jgi:hypothetical protein
MRSLRVPIKDRTGKLKKARAADGHGLGTSENEDVLSLWAPPRFGDVAPNSEVTKRSGGTSLPQREVPETKTR